MFFYTSFKFPTSPAHILFPAWAFNDTYHAFGVTSDIVLNFIIFILILACKFFYSFPAGCVPNFHARLAFTAFKETMKFMHYFLVLFDVAIGSQILQIRCLSEGHFFGLSANLFPITESLRKINQLRLIIFCTLFVPLE